MTPGELSALSTPEARALLRALAEQPVAQRLAAGERPLKNAAKFIQWKNRAA